MLRKYETLQVRPHLTGVRMIMTSKKIDESNPMVIETITCKSPIEVVDSLINFSRNAFFGILYGAGPATLARMAKRDLK